MKNLVGKTINNWVLSKGDEKLTVYCEEGVLVYDAVGD